MGFTAGTTTDGADLALLTHTVSLGFSSRSFLSLNVRWCFWHCWVILISSFFSTCSGSFWKNVCSFGSVDVLVRRRPPFRSYTELQHLGRLCKPEGREGVSQFLHNMISYVDHSPCLTICLRVPWVRNNNFCHSITTKYFFAAPLQYRHEWMLVGLHLKIGTSNQLWLSSASYLFYKTERQYSAMVMQKRQLKFEF